MLLFERPLDPRALTTECLVLTVYSTGAAFWCHISAVWPDAMAQSMQSAL